MPTYSVKTLADLKQSISDRHDNGTVPTNSTILARYVRLLNRGVNYCADRMRLTTSDNITVAAVGNISFASLQSVRNKLNRNRRQW